MSHHCKIEFHRVRKVKVYPEIGPAFYVIVPEDVEDIDLFLDDHLKNVASWDESV